MKCSSSLCGLCASVFQFLCMVRCNQSHLELNLGSLYEQAAMARSKSSGLTSHHFFKPSKAGLRLESA